MIAQARERGRRAREAPENAGIFGVIDWLSVGDKIAGQADQVGPGGEAHVDGALDQGKRNNAGGVKIGELKNSNLAGESTVRQSDAVMGLLQPARLDAKRVHGRRAQHRDE